MFALFDGGADLGRNRARAAFGNDPRPETEAEDVEDEGDLPVAENGGAGDADFVENKIIVDLAGIGVYASTAQVEPNTGFEMKPRPTDSAEFDEYIDYLVEVAEPRTAEERAADAQVIRQDRLLDFTGEELTEAALLATRDRYLAR